MSLAEAARHTCHRQDRGDVGVRGVGSQSPPPKKLRGLAYDAGPVGIRFDELVAHVAAKGVFAEALACEGLV